MSNRFSDGGVVAGSTGVSVPVLLRKAADSTEQTGVAFGSAAASYRRQGAATVTITTVALAASTDAWTAGGWFEPDTTNQPGTYRLDVPDAAWAAGADWVLVAVKVAGCFVAYERFALTGDLALVAATAGSVTLAAGDPDRGSTGLIGSRIYVTGGAQGGTSATFTGNPSAGVATVGAWTQGTPAAGSPYAILPPGGATSGSVTVAGYATGQDPATLTWAAGTRSLTDKAGYSLATAPPTASAITTAVVAGMATAPVGAVANISTVALDSGTVAGSPAPSATTFSSTSVTLTATQSGAYVGSGIVFQSTTSLGRVRRVVTGHAVVAGSPARHDFTVTTSSGATPLVGPAATDTFEVC